MGALEWNTEDVKRLQRGARLTKDRYEREGFDDASDMDMLEELCECLITGRNVDAFMSEQDMEIPKR